MMPDNLRDLFFLYLLVNLEMTERVTLIRCEKNWLTHQNYLPEEDYLSFEWLRLDLIRPRKTIRAESEIWIGPEIVDDGLV